MNDTSDSLRFRRRFAADTFTGDTAGLVLGGGPGDDAVDEVVRGGPDTDRSRAGDGPEDCSRKARPLGGALMVLAWCEAADGRSCRELALLACSWIGLMDRRLDSDEFLAMRRAISRERRALSLRSLSMSFDEARLKRGFRRRSSCCFPGSMIKQQVGDDTNAKYLLFHRRKIRSEDSQSERMLINLLEPVCCRGFMVRGKGLQKGAIVAKAKMQSNFRRVGHLRGVCVQGSHQF